MEEVFWLEEWVMRILRRWRFVLALAVLFALLAGCYAALTTKGDEEEEQSTNVTVSPEVSPARHESAEAYIEGGIAAGLDPYRISVSEFSLFIRPEQEDGDRAFITRSVLHRYADALGADALYQELAQELDWQWETDYLREAVWLRWEDAAASVTVIGGSADMTAATARKVAEYLGDMQEAVAAQSYGHALDLGAYHHYTATENSLWVFSGRSTQGLNYSIAGMNNTYNQYIKSLPPLPKQETGKPDINIVRRIALYTLLCGALGGVLGVLLVLLFDAVRTGIYTGGELRQRLGLRFLGSASRSTGNAIDRWIDRLEGIPAGQSEEELLRVIGENLRSALDGDTEEILACSSLADAELSGFCDRLNEAMDGKIKVRWIGNPCYSAQAVQALSHRGGAILLEKRKTSKYRALVVVQERMKDLDKEIYGAILL